MKNMIFLFFFLNLLLSVCANSSKTSKSAFIVHLDLNLLSRFYQRNEINGKETIDDDIEVGNQIAANFHGDIGNGFDHLKNGNNKRGEGNATRENQSEKPNSGSRKAFQLKAIASVFEKAEPMKLQLWQRATEPLAYQLVWSHQLAPRIFNGSVEIITLNESDWPVIDPSTMFVGVEATQRGSPVTLNFCGLEGNLLFILDCDSTSLDVGSRCRFDGLRQPFCLHLFLCRETDCSDMLESSSTMCPPCSLSDELLPRCAPTDPEICFNASVESHKSLNVLGERESSFNNILIGLIIWNTILTVIILIIIVCMSRAFIKIRILHKTRQTYVVNRWPPYPNIK